MSLIYFCPPYHLVPLPSDEDKVIQRIFLYLKAFDSSEEFVKHEFQGYSRRKLRQFLSMSDAVTLIPYDDYEDHKAGLIIKEFDSVPLLEDGEYVVLPATTKVALSQLVCNFSHLVTLAVMELILIT